ncbi:MAG: 2-C-methyl-D-erythritol 2,4-cyclodiphosphate synthase [Vicinamibacteria bacterium]|nr:2-C-methyl-D-erythritol 2,4-cyclodiphosphate synthase [Vicinamibacteria bacterium]
MSFRIGTGFDVHRLAAGRPLMLGGVQIPHEAGLVGHSDGDCLLHAVCDALLGAAAAGDMGEHFPSSDPRWRGAASLIFVAEVRRLLADRGFVIENVDATVVAQAPRLAPHLAALRTSLASALGLVAGQVSVKAKSSDGLGAIGRGEGIAAQAVALVSSPRGTNQA